MELNKNHIFKFVGLSVLILILPLLLSCSDNLEIEGTQNNEEQKENTMILHISPLTRDGDNTTGLIEDIEDIKSLRIILVDKSGKIVTNKFISIETQSEIPYNWDFKTSYGKYSVFIIANEQSITEWYIDGLDSDYRDTSLTTMIDSYNIGRSGFENFISSIYFKPDYTKLISRSCNYEINFNKEGQKFELYLVPVATKFKINFKNFRNDQVKINKVSLSSVADLNYLIANLDETEKTKTIDGSTYYWIDWLKEVSEDTNNHPDIDNSYNSNDYINQKYGWISGYKMPDKANYSEKHLVSNDNPLEIEKGELITGEDPKPAEESIGPFYFPESKNISNNEQYYALTFEIYSDTEEDKKITKPLENVLTLFRNSFVQINVEMNNGYERIYVEISVWKEIEPAYGIITQ